jgi:hypothetical protein
MPTSSPRIRESEVGPSHQGTTGWLRASVTGAERERIMGSQVLGIDFRKLCILESFDQDVSILRDCQERHEDLGSGIWAK